MSRPRTFAQVDVFSRTPYLGNPVAVILDGEGLADEEMQQIARWTNLSETTFVLPPTTDAADYRLRIFTPGGELPFAGHPTLGSAHAWLANGGTPRDAGTIVQECAAGLVRVRRGDGILSFAAPPTIRSGELAGQYLEQISRNLLAPRRVSRDESPTSTGQTGAGGTTILSDQAPARVQVRCTSRSTRSSTTPRTATSFSGGWATGLTTGWTPELIASPTSSRTPFDGQADTTRSGPSRYT